MAPESKVIVQIALYLYMHVYIVHIQSSVVMYTCAHDWTAKVAKGELKYSLLV